MGARVYSIGHLAQAAEDTALATVPYIVKRGESLTLITWRFGREPQDWLVLYFTNEDLIGEDPESLRAGVAIRVPGGWPPQPIRAGGPPLDWVRRVPPLTDAQRRRWAAISRPAAPAPPAPQQAPTVAPTPSKPKTLQGLALLVGAVLGVVALAKVLAK